MKTMDYCNETFWMITDNSGMRPHKLDRVKVLIIESDGTVQCKSRTMRPDMLATLKDQFQREALG